MQMWKDHCIILFHLFFGLLVEHNIFIFQFGHRKQIYIVYQSFKNKLNDQIINFWILFIYIISSWIPLSFNLVQRLCLKVQITEDVCLFVPTVCPWYGCYWETFEKTLCFKWFKLMLMQLLLSASMLWMTCS